MRYKIENNTVNVEGMKVKDTQGIQTQFWGVNMYKREGGDRSTRGKNFQVFNHDWSNAYVKELK
jgi:hypothetical protein